MTTPAPTRDLGIDLLRAVCILYIVGYWHLCNYTAALPNYANAVTLGFTYAALATFVFCSGWLLARQRVTLQFVSLGQFYQRRLLRIYPLYAITLLLFGVTGLANSRQVIDGLLLLSMFDPPAMQTLWFITMMMWFYVLAPLLIHSANQPRRLITITVIIIALLTGYQLSGQALDLRVLLYFPVFVLGIAYRQHPALGEWLRQRPLLISGAVLLAWLLSGNGHTFTVTGVLWNLPFIITSALALFIVADIPARYLHAPTIRWLAYASFGLYLCHRLVFQVVIGIYYPTAPTDQLVYLLLLPLPLSILIGYAMQRGYDTLMARYAPSK